MRTVFAETATHSSVERALDEAFAVVTKAHDGVIGERRRGRATYEDWKRCADQGMTAMEAAAALGKGSVNSAYTASQRFPDIKFRPAKKGRAKK